MGAPLDKMEPDGEGKRKQPFDLIGFREPNHTNPERNELGFIDHEVRNKWQGLENRVIMLAHGTKTARVKDKIAILNGQITQSVIDVDVVGWLCQVYDIALTNIKDRHAGWEVEVNDMWKEVNYHWHLTTGTLRDRLDAYYQKLLAMKELDLWNDRDSFGDEVGETTEFKL